jgi:hypothetical protein
MKDEALHELAALINQDFEPVPIDEIISEERLLELLSLQLEWMIEHRLEHLMSMMYRLDIDERNVASALSPAGPEPPALALARLVLNRQKQRIFTKRHYKQSFPEQWNWDE